MSHIEYVNRTKTMKINLKIRRDIQNIAYP